MQLSGAAVGHMICQVLHFDVFTSRPGKGNPAGIVLSGDDLDPSVMQSIALATAFSDTAFICSSQAADFRIRYFAPRKEVDLCGHATIAASIALQTRGPLAGKSLPCRFSLQTNAGILPITIDTTAAGETMVFMSQAPSSFKEFKGDCALLVHALGISAADLHPTLPILYGSTGRWTLIVPVRNLDAMRRMSPRPAEFAEALADLPQASIHPFCLEAIGPDVAAHARHFSAPDSGTLEDPVTGTGSGVLGAYYGEFVDKMRDSSQPLVIEQGYEMEREGEVLVWAVRNNDHYAVRIGGSACFVDVRVVDRADVAPADANPVP
jgi:PhzF family phenazine biosynthesis protein